jgi:hypothetical protein
VITWPVIWEASFRIAAASTGAALFAFSEDPPPSTKQLHGAPVKRRRGERRPLDESSSSYQRHIHPDQFPAISSLVRETFGLPEQRNVKN